jgi:hypothetical protein
LLAAKGRLSAECGGGLLENVLYLEKLTHGRVSLELLWLDHETVVLSKVGSNLASRCDRSVLRCAAAAVLPVSGC